MTRDLLADIEDGRFELDWASDVDQALEEMCSEKYDLFLIDYNLGRTDGLTLLEDGHRSRVYGAHHRADGTRETRDRPGGDAGRRGWLSGEVRP